MTSPMTRTPSGVATIHMTSGLLLGFPRCAGYGQPNPLSPLFPPYHVYLCQFGYIPSGVASKFDMIGMSFEKTKRLVSYLLVYSFEQTGSHGLRGCRGGRGSGWGPRGHGWRAVVSGIQARHRGSLRTRATRLHANRLRWKPFRVFLA